MACPASSAPGSVAGLSSRRRAVLASTLASLPWLLAGCPAAAPIRLAGHPWPGYQPMFLAQALGYLPDGVQLHETSSVQESLDLTRQRRVDGVMLTLDEVLQLRDQGLALGIVLVFDVSRGADMLLARPDLRTLADLKRRRVGVEDTALGTLMLTLVLDKAGLRREDVVVHRMAYERHEAAWLGREIDALITYEPVGGRLMALGAHQLLSTRQLPATIFDVLAVHRGVLESQVDTLRTGLAAYFKALRYLRQNPWDAAYRLAPRLQISAEAMIDSLRGLELPDLVGNQRYLAEQGSALLQAALRLSPIMQQAGLLHKPVDPRRLLSNRYLPQS